MEIHLRRAEAVRVLARRIRSGASPWHMLAATEVVVAVMVATTSAVGTTVTVRVEASGAVLAPCAVVVVTLLVTARLPVAVVAGV